MGHVFTRGAKWYVRWADAVGRRRRKATTAKTRREALALLAELEAQVSRVKLGLQAAPVQSRETFHALCEWYLNEVCPEASRENERARLKKHVYAFPLGQTPLALITTDAIAQRLVDAEKSGGPGGRRLKPATINRLRTTLHAVFGAASKPPRRWHGQNPVTEVPIRAVEPIEPVVLVPEVIGAVLAQVNDYWRGVIAVGLYLALRKGEIYGLRKTDYDRRHQVLRVARSHQRNTTKGKRVDTLPVPAVLRPYLDAAFKSSRSFWLFPNVKGEQRGRETDPHLVLRRAVKRAGAVERWEQWCRRCVHRKGKTKVPVSITPKKPPQARCPVCNMVMWVRAVPPHIRFHDTRHSSATNLIRAGVPLPQLQRIIRHADVRTTIKTYGHLVTEDLREAVNAVDHSARSASGGAGFSPKQAPQPPQQQAEKE